MAQAQYIAAIEIGSSKIVGAIAERMPSGHVQVYHLEVEKLVNSVRHGCVQNVENTKGIVNSIIRKLENRVGGSIEQVYVGLSGRSLHSEPTEVNHNLDSTVPITDKVLQSIIGEAGKDPIKNYETVAVVPRTFFVDKNETPSPSGQFGSNINIKLNLIVAKPTLKLNIDRVMNGSTRIKDYLVTPLVVADEILQDSEKKLGCMLVDMGAETTTVSIYKKGTLVYLSTLPLGSRNITRDITTGLNVLEDTAERVKKNISNPLDQDVEQITIEGVNSTDAAPYISARIGEIIANVNQQIIYSGLKNTDLHNVVLIGGGAQLHGIARRLEEDLKLKVRLGEPPASLNILDHNINRAEYIQIFSLLSKASEMIASRESCVKIDSYDNPYENPVPRQEPPAYGGGYDTFRVEELPPRRPDVTVDDEETPREKPKKKKRSFLEIYRDKINKIMSDDDEL